MVNKSIEDEVRAIVNRITREVPSHEVPAMGELEDEAVAALMRLMEQADTRCWHCGLMLIGVARPRCEQCPAECDVEGCDRPGCEGNE